MTRALSLIAALAFAPPAYAAPPTNCLPPQIKRVLSHLERNYGSVEIISTYRKGAVIAGTRKRSLHSRCMAADIHLHGRKRAAMAWLRTQPVEIITYGGVMHHWHIGVGSYRGHHIVNGRGVRR